MKYDNPKNRGVIDGCVERILAKSDDEFLKYVNTEKRWVLDIAQELYAELRLAPSNCFRSVGPAMQYFQKTVGETFHSQKAAGQYYILWIGGTEWSIEVHPSSPYPSFSIGMKLGEDHFLIAMDDCIPAGVILAIACHYAYIQECAKPLVLETEKRHMIQSINKLARQ